MFECTKTSKSLIDNHKPFVWKFKSYQEWGVFEADYKRRGIAGATFEKVSDREFIFTTSNATRCQFVRTDV